jgi:hypothetical protein
VFRRDAGPPGFEPGTSGLESHGPQRGRVLAPSNYWLKLGVNKKQIYINKPFIVYIKTLENRGSHTTGQY